MCINQLPLPEISWHLASFGIQVFTNSCCDYDKSFYVVKKHKNVTCKHHMWLAAELSIMA